MTRRARWLLWGGLFVAAVCAAFVRWQFGRDLASAAARAAQGSTVVTTRCGPIEVQQAGEGIPLLMIHGEGDTYIKPEMARALFERVREPKELWVVPNAKHNQALHTAGDEYHRRVVEFFDRHLARVDEATVPAGAD